MPVLRSQLRWATVLMLDTCGRFGGSQTLHNPFFSAGCGGFAATASGKRGDLGEAEAPQTPLPHKLYHNTRNSYAMQRDPHTADRAVLIGDYVVYQAQILRVEVA